jgi:hypothetical protein
MDSATLLLGTYEWLERLVNQDGFSFVCYAMHSNGKKGPGGKRGNEAIESWWFASEAEGAVVTQWNKTWVAWVSRGTDFGSVKAYLDEPWWKGDPRQNAQKRYLAIEVALMYARNRTEASKREFDEGRVWIGNAGKDPFYLNGRQGWEKGRMEQLSLEALGAYERDTLGHPVRFWKFTGGLAVLKKAGLDPLVSCPEGSAARFLFAVHGHGIYEDSKGSSSVGALSVSAAASDNSHVAAIAMGVALMLLSVFAVAFDFSTLRGRKWTVPRAMAVLLVFDIVFIAVLASIQPDLGATMSESVSLGADKFGLFGFERAAQEFALVSGADRWQELEDLLVVEGGNMGGMLIHGCSLSVRVSRRVASECVGWVSSRAEAAFLSSKKSSGGPDSTLTGAPDAYRKGRFGGKGFTVAVPWSVLTADLASRATTSLVLWDESRLDVSCPGFSAAMDLAVAEGFRLSDRGGDGITLFVRE